jgi:hypothetical protein
MNVDITYKKLPFLGLILSFILIVLATFQYPGGTILDNSTVGYSWTENTFSALFQPYALNGFGNSARFLAITSVFFYCVSLAFVFNSIAHHSASSTHRSLIKTAGIGSMVYAFLIVTPMHNLMVNIALMFYLVAVFSILHSLYLLKLNKLMIFGLFCVSLPIFNAAIYYLDILYFLLPFIQKLGMFACLVWLLVIYLFHSSSSHKL